MSEQLLKALDAFDGDESGTAVDEPLHPTLAAFDSFEDPRGLGERTLEKVVDIGMGVGSGLEAGVRSDVPALVDSAKEWWADTRVERHGEDADLLAAIARDEITYADIEGGETEALRALRERFFRQPLPFDRRILDAMQEPDRDKRLDALGELDNELKTRFNETIESGNVAAASAEENRRQGQEIVEGYNLIPGGAGEVFSEGARGAVVMTPAIAAGILAAPVTGGASLPAGATFMATAFVSQYSQNMAEGMTPAAAQADASDRAVIEGLSEVLKFKSLWKLARAVGGKRKLAQKLTNGAEAVGMGWFSEALNAQLNALYDGGVLTGEESADKAWDIVSSSKAIRETLHAGNVGAATSFLLGAPAAAIGVARGRGAARDDKGEPQFTDTRPAQAERESRETPTSAPAAAEPSVAAPQATPTESPPTTADSSESPLDALPPEIVERIDTFDVNDPKALSDLVSDISGLDYIDNDVVLAAVERIERRRTPVESPPAAETTKAADTGDTLASEETRQQVEADAQADEGAARQAALDAEREVTRQAEVEPVVSEDETESAEVPDVHAGSRQIPTTDERGKPVWPKPSSSGIEALYPHDGTENMAEVFDARLKRRTYRDGLYSMWQELEVGGGRRWREDEHGRLLGGEEGGLTPSANPPWFKNSGWTRKQVIGAVDALFTGRKLGTRQRTIIETMLEDIATAGRGPDGRQQDVEFRVQQLEEARALRRWANRTGTFRAEDEGLARSGEQFEPDEYMEGDSPSERALYEMGVEASEYDAEAFDELPNNYTPEQLAREYARIIARGRIRERETRAREGTPQEDSGRPGAGPQGQTPSEGVERGPLFSRKQRSEDFELETPKPARKPLPRRQQTQTDLFGGKSAGKQAETDQDAARVRKAADAPPPESGEGLFSGEQQQKPLFSQQKKDQLGNATDKRKSVTQAAAARLRQVLRTLLRLSPGPRVDSEIVWRARDAGQQIDGLVIVGREAAQVQVGTFAYNKRTVDTAEDAAALLAPIRKRATEHLYALVLDADNRPLAVLRHSGGIRSSVRLDPIAMTGAVARIRAASSVWVAHNHPSKRFKHSADDLKANATFLSRLPGDITFAGSIVIAPGQRQFSHATAEGTQATAVIPAQGAPALRSKRPTQVPEISEEWRGRVHDAPFSLDSDGDVVALADRWLGQRDGYIFVDNALDVIGILPVGNAHNLKTPYERPQVRDVFAGFSQTGTNRAIAVARDADAARNLVAFLNHAAGNSNEGAAAMVHGEPGQRTISLPEDGLPQWDVFFSRLLAPPSESSATGQPVAKVEAQIEALRDKWRWGHVAPPRIVVLDNAANEALPPRLRQSDSGFVTEGFYDDPAYGGDGTVYLFADHLATPADVRRVLAHEAVGHASALELLGQRGRDEIVGRLERLRAMGNQRVVDAYATVRGRDDTLTPEHEALEVIAVLQEQRIESGPVAALLRRVRELMRQFLSSVGLDGREFTDADIDILLTQAERRLRALPAEVVRQREATAEAALRSQAMNWYHSGLAAVMTGKDKPAKQSAANWLKSVDKALKQGKVHPEEVKWTGLRAFLEDQGEREVTKAEMQDWLDSNRVVVEAGTLEPLERDGSMYEDMTLPGPRDDYRVIGFALPQMDTSQSQPADHFGLPKGFGHARVTVREGMQGERFLMVEELQSDLHQRASRSRAEQDGVGYDSEVPDTEVERRALRQELDAMHRAKDRAEKVDEKRYGELLGLLHDAPGYYTQPDAPFRSNWRQVMMKHLLHHAAEQGLDGVAWPSTAAQVEAIERWPEGQASKSADGSGTPGALRAFAKDIPRFVSRFGKQWGAQPTTIDLPLSAESTEREERARLMSDYRANPADSVSTTLNYLPLTDKLRVNLLRNGSPLFARQLGINPRWYYSGLARQVRESMALPKKAQSGTKWLALLNKMADKGTVKREEIEWTGTVAFLEGAGDARVTREELLAYIQANEVVVDVQVVSESDDNISEQREQAREALYDVGWSEEDVDAARMAHFNGEALTNLQESLLDTHADLWSEFLYFEDLSPRHAGPPSQDYDEYLHSGEYDNYRIITLDLKSLPESTYTEPYWNTSNSFAHARTTDRLALAPESQMTGEQKAALQSLLDVRNEARGKVARLRKQRETLVESEGAFLYDSIQRGLRSDVPWRVREEVIRLRQNVALNDAQKVFLKKVHELSAEQSEAAMQAESAQEGAMKARLAFRKLQTTAAHGQPSKDVLFVEEVQSHWHEDAAKAGGYEGTRQRANFERKHEQKIADAEQARRDILEDPQHPLVARHQESLARERTQRDAAAQAGRELRGQLSELDLESLVGRFAASNLSRDAALLEDQLEQARLTPSTTHSSKLDAARELVNKLPPDAREALRQARRQKKLRDELVTEARAAKRGLDEALPKPPAALEPTNPDAPFKKTWPIATVRAMLRRAAEQGYEYMALPATWKQVSNVQNYPSDVISNRPSKLKPIHDRYMDVLPRYLQSVARNLGGEWMQVDIDAGGGNTETVNAIRITPELKKHLLAGNQPLFSRKRTYTPEQQAAIKQVDPGARGRGLREILSFASVGAWLRHRGQIEVQRAFDPYYPIKKQIGLQEWKQTRMTHAAAEALEAFATRTTELKLDDDGAIDVTRVGGTGLFEKLAPLGDEVMDFMRWMVGNRVLRINAAADAAQAELFQVVNQIAATRAQISQLENSSVPVAAAAGQLRSLNAQLRKLLTRAADQRARSARRERHLEPQRAQALAELNRGTLADGADRAALYERVRAELERAGNNLIAMNVRAGNVNAQVAASWDREFYIPLFREMGDMDGLLEGVARPSLVNQTPIKRFVGGGEPINDLLENMLVNYSNLIASALRNNALTSIVEKGMAIQDAADPIFTRVSERPAGESKRHFFLRRDGKMEWYHVHDEMMAVAIGALDDKGIRNRAVDVMSAFKRIKTLAVVTTPTFQAAQTLRDAMMTAATTPAGFNVAGHIAEGWWSARDREFGDRITAAGGVLSGAHFHVRDPRTLHRAIGRFQREANLGHESLARRGFNVISNNTWGRYRAVLDVNENASRRRVYLQMRRQGASHFEAAFQARDIHDTTLRGAGGLARFLSATVPFYSAAMFGAYKMGRTAFDPAVRLRLLTVTGALAVASVALVLAYRDDEDYLSLTDQERARYWFFKVGDRKFLVVKPFEVGALASSVQFAAEAALRDDVNAKQASKHIAETLVRNFGYGGVPLPAGLDTAIEQMANYNLHWKSPIEPQYMESRLPSRRYRHSTPLMLKDASRGLSNVLPESLTPSPLRMEHAIESVFASVGATALDWSQQAYPRLQGITPPTPSVRMIPGAGGFLSPQVPTRTRQSNLFYEWERMAKQFSDERKRITREAPEGADIDVLINARMTAREQRMADEARGLGKTRSFLGGLYKDIGEIRADPNMGRRDKDKRIEALRREINAEAAQTVTQMRPVFQ